MYHPYQNQVAKRTMKERRELADLAQRVSVNRGNNAKPWIHLRDRFAVLVSSRSDRLGKWMKAAQKWEAATNAKAQE